MAVLVSGAGSIIDKSAVCFKIVLPTNFNKTVLVAPFDSRLIKEQGCRLFWHIETFLMRGFTDIISSYIAAKGLPGVIYLRNGVV